MKEARECLALARHCEELADNAMHPEGQRMLLQIASQWRKLADASPHHRLMISTGVYASGQEY